MKNCITILALSFLTLQTSSLFAGSGTGRILEFTAHHSAESNYAFSVETRADAPACATTKRFVTSNKELMAAILAAKLANKSITAFGSGTCEVWGDSETIWAISFSN